MIDDAAPVAAGGRTVAAPAQVVERAPFDAQEFGSLVDGEKGRVVVIIVVIFEHHGGLQDIDGVSLSE
jgi:hypothetical protein